MIGLLVFLVILIMKSGMRRFLGKLFVFFDLIIV